MYGNTHCDTNCHCLVLTKAEYVYSDGVALYSLVYIRVNDNEIRIMKISETSKLVNEKWTTSTWLDSPKMKRQHVLCYQLLHFLYCWVMHLMLYFYYFDGNIKNCPNNSIKTFSKNSQTLFANYPNY